MGLLDDAIREHLELKRRHGADPAELDQQERDALGPTRRGDAGTPDARELEPLDDEPVRARREPEDDVTAPPRAAAPSPPPAAPPARALDLDPSWDEEDDHDLAAPPRRPEAGSVRVERPADAPLADPERTRAFSVEEERDALGPVPDEPPARTRRRAEPVEEADELEETPEFLEDTPEHDRLWFEQRPPKDFDF
jgi:hypothetical protein